MQRFSHDKPCSDHLGNIYGSIKAMCSFWHIKPETYSRRLTVYNMTVEEALTRPVKHNGGLKCTDHHGHKYRSITSMCTKWGINRKLYKYRISQGVLQVEQEDGIEHPQHLAFINMVGMQIADDFSHLHGQMLCGIRRKGLFGLMQLYDG